MKYEIKKIDKSKYKCPPIENFELKIFEELKNSYLLHDFFEIEININTKLNQEIINNLNNVLNEIEQKYIYESELSVLIITKKKTFIINSSYSYLFDDNNLSSNNTENCFEIDTLEFYNLAKFWYITVKNNFLEK